MKEYTKDNSFYCPICKAYLMIEWKKYKINNFWMDLFFNYYKGRYISNEGALEGETSNRVFKIGEFLEDIMSDFFLTFLPKIKRKLLIVYYLIFLPFYIKNKKYVVKKEFLEDNDKGITILRNNELIFAFSYKELKKYK